MFDKIIAHNPSVKLTPLRKDVLSILLKSNKAMSAYEILHALKKKRPNAEPPTVYRVIEYFVDKHVVHRIATDNKFVICTEQQHSEPHEQAILFLCKICHKSLEVINKELIKTVQNLANKQHFDIHSPTFEISGICQQCQATQ